MMERGTLFIPTSTGPLRLMPGSDHVDLFGPQEPARTVTRLSGRRLVVVYPIISAEGNQNSRIRWFDTTPEMNLLGEMNFGGLTIGSPQIAEDWMILAFQDGRLIGCQFEDDSLQEIWETRIGSGRTLLAGATYGSGLIASVASNRDGGVLSVVHAQKGEVLREQPVQGDFLIPPIWWERTLSLVNGAGGLEVFRISI